MKLCKVLLRRNMHLNGSIILRGEELDLERDEKGVSAIDIRYGGEYVGTIVCYPDHKNTWEYNIPHGLFKLI